MRAAIAVLPFESPKLAVTAMVSEQDLATVLDRRLKRIEEMKAKAIDATPLIDGEKVDVRLHDCLIDASGGFDHYPTGRNLIILGHH